MAKKTKKKVAKRVTRTRSIGENNFVLIAGGGFVVIALIFLISGGFSPRSYIADKIDAPAEEKMVAKNTVVIDSSSFAPETLTVKAGDTVTFVNYDAIEHTATADDGSFDTDVLALGESATVTFDTPGTYTYRCSIHPNITGTIVVEE